VISLLAAVRQKKTTGNVSATGWTLIREDGTSARTSLLRRVAGTESGPTPSRLRGVGADAVGVDRVGLVDV
jgi:hypothetical protein